ncbi:hypothetical protein DESPIGER_1873 [Desulfovibrio piger]|uniref:Uncharacterized protein n=1 Tax=Desulfovibrio piger TaxID=901 RepID=A0A1K1LJP2_9BACT|nr:hypothetical protein DESPIGER_1873 [Desulfovibrio piger]
MARCRPACPQGENGGPVEKMGLPGRCPEKWHEKSAGDRAFWHPFPQKGLR